MTRALRRSLTERKIARRIRLFFTYWGWGKSNWWYWEPHRLSKQGTGLYPWWYRDRDERGLALPKRVLEHLYGEHVTFLTKRNRKCQSYTRKRWR